MKNLTFYEFQDECLRFINEDVWNTTLDEFCNLQNFKPQDLEQYIQANITRDDLDDIIWDDDGTIYIGDMEVNKISNQQIAVQLEKEFKPIFLQQLKEKAKELNWYHNPVKIKKII